MQTASPARTYLAPRFRSLPGRGQRTYLPLATQTLPHRFIQQLDTNNSKRLPRDCSAAGDTPSRAAFKNGNPPARDLCPPSPCPEPSAAPSPTGGPERRRPALTNCPASGAKRHRHPARSAVGATPQSAGRARGAPERSELLDSASPPVPSPPGQGRAEEIGAPPPRAGPPARLALSPPPAAAGPRAIPRAPPPLSRPAPHLSLPPGRSPLPGRLRL